MSATVVVSAAGGSFVALLLLVMARIGVQETAGAARLVRRLDFAAGAMATVLVALLAWRVLSALG